VIRAGVAVSTEEDTERAAQEATAAALDRAGLDSADWALVFATPAHRPAYSRMLGAVARTCGSSSVVGCCGVGVLASDREIEGGFGVAVLVVTSDTLSAWPFFVREADDWRAVAEACRAASAGAPERDRGAGLLVLLPDPSLGRLDRVLSMAVDSFGEVPVVGGARGSTGVAGSPGPTAAGVTASSSTVGIAGAAPTASAPGVAAPR